MTNGVIASLGDVVRKDATALIVLGILIVVLGFLAMIAPVVAGVAVATLVGLILIGAGILRTIFAFKCKTWGRGLFTGVLGVLTLACGVFMLARPMLGLISLTLVLAVYFIAEGIAEVVGAFRVKPVSGWGWMLASGVMSVILGICIWIGWPVTGVWAIGILVGIKLLFAGATIAGIGFAARSATSLLRERNA